DFRPCKGGSTHAHNQARRVWPVNTIRVPCVHTMRGFLTHITWSPATRARGDELVYVSYMPNTDSADPDAMIRLRLKIARLRRGFVTAKDAARWIEKHK